MQLPAWLAGLQTEFRLPFAGSLLGMLTDRGRGTILHFDVETLYNNVALGLMCTVAALRTFGTSRTVFFREASSGLNK